MYKLTKLLPAFVLLALAVIAPTEARADAVAITGGFYEVDNPFRTVPNFVDSSFNFSGNNLSARGTNFDAPQQAPHSNCGTPCLAGSTFSLTTGTFLNTDGPTGTFTLDGVSHTGWFIGSSLNFTSGTVTIPLDAPTDPAQDFTLTTTFTMTGTLGFAEYDLQNQVFTGFNYDSPVFGSGLADITLFFSRVTHEYEIGSVTYRFQPASVPEPATLILLGTGLAGAAAYRRRRGRGAPR